MTTIVNSPTPSSDSGSGGMIVGIFAIIVFGLIFVYFGLPAIRRLGQSQINLPAPQIAVPDKIDVNVKQTP